MAKNRDLTKEDITCTLIKGMWIATLGFCKIPEDNNKKQYYATGETKKEAINNLIYMLIKHLERLK